MATLNATIPSGYTASWTHYNIMDWERYGNKTTTNATIANANTASPTLSLTKKANHDIDPAYRAVLRITSINNPNCWYEDDAIVRFIPNPNLILNATNDRCYSSTDTDRYITLNTNSSVFATGYPNVSGNPAFGTTVTINAVNQPAGGNISFKEIRGTNLFFNGVNVTGTYVFTITVTNSNGTYTTPQITYNYNGTTPNNVSFVDRPDYKKIFNDIIFLKFPERQSELRKYLEENELSALDAINLNQLIFNSKNKQQSFSSKYRSYTKSDILKLLDYQKKNKLNNLQLANEFGLSRNTVAKWKRIFTI